MTKKYHMSWYWCQNIRDNMVEKGKNSGKALPPPHFRAMPERKRFFIRGVPLIPLYFYTPWDSRSSTKSWLLSLTATWSAELPGKKQTCCSVPREQHMYIYLLCFVLSSHARNRQSSLLFIIYNYGNNQTYWIPPIDVAFLKNYCKGVLVPFFDRVEKQVEVAFFTFLFSSLCVTTVDLGFNLFPHQGVTVVKDLWRKCFQFGFIISTQVSLFHKILGSVKTLNYYLWIIERHCP